MFPLHEPGVRTWQTIKVHLLIPNLGSTSLKYQILEMPSERVIAKGRMERVSNYRDAIATIGTGDIAIDAVAFKAVLAGPDYRGTFVIDDAVVRAMRQFGTNLLVNPGSTCKSRQVLNSWKTCRLHRICIILQGCFILRNYGWPC